jgi:hypothetical protein
MNTWSEVRKFAPVYEVDPSPWIFKNISPKNLAKLGDSD